MICRGKERDKMVPYAYVLLKLSIRGEYNTNYEFIQNRNFGWSLSFFLLYFVTLQFKQPKILGAHGR